MTTTRARVRAPELRGAGGWIGTSEPLTLRGLRGRFVLLDFWTSCCVNCLHVLDEPEGYVVHTASGEGHGEGLGRLLEQLVAEHDARSTLRRGGAPHVAPP